MAGYTRQDTDNDISNGSVIDADLFDAEYDAIAAAFHAATGHKHDGTATEGPPITVIGPAQDFVASADALSPKTDAAYDLGTAALRYDSGFFASVRASGSGGGNFIASSVLQSAASGHYSWTDDSDTSMYRSAANTIEFGTAGLSRLVIGPTGAITIAQTLTVAGVLTATGGVVGNVTGNASTATALATARNFSITGGATAAAVSFSGAGNVALNVTDLNATNLTAGTLPAARLGTTGSDRTWVGVRYAECKDTSVGCVVFARYTGAADGIDFLEQVAANDISPANANGNASGDLDGVWECLGRIQAGASTNVEKTTLWRRITP